MTYEETLNRCTIVIGAMEAFGRACKMRFRVKAPTRMHSFSVPCDAVPGDLVVGNRGAAAMVTQPPSQFGGLAKVLTLEHVGNYHYGARPAEGCKLYDFSGGTRP